MRRTALAAMLLLSGLLAIGCKNEKPEPDTPVTKTDTPVTKTDTPVTKTDTPVSAETDVAPADPVEKSTVLGAVGKSLLIAILSDSGGEDAGDGAGDIVQPKTGNPSPFDAPR